MKKFVVATVALIGLLAGCSSSNSAVQKVDVQQFGAVVATAGTVILDVRTPEEFAQGHLPNAVNINVEDPNFDSAIANLDKAATYAVYCRSGNRSGIATARMADAGFTTLYDLQGGIVDWAAAGGQVVS